jgi:hypothetical protein
MIILHDALNNLPIAVLQNREAIQTKCRVSSDAEESQLQQQLDVPECTTG